MSMAIAGKIDCIGPIVINYKRIDRFLFALVEEYTGDWHYRIFICEESFRYERRYILDPIIGTGNPRCLYDYYWNINSGKTELRYFEESNWTESIDEIAKII